MRRSLCVVPVVQFDERVLAAVEVTDAVAPLSFGGDAIYRQVPTLS